MKFLQTSRLVRGANHKLIFLFLKRPVVGTQKYRFLIQAQSLNEAPSHFFKNSKV